MKITIYIVLALVLAFFVKVEVFHEPGTSFFRDSRSARLLFAGDMMFDRTIRSKVEAAAGIAGSSASKDKGYDLPFSCMADYMKSFDTVVANLEGPITEYLSTSAGTLPGQPGNTSFTFAPDVARALYDNNVRVANLGNNHSSDKGRAGANSTQAYLFKAGVAHFGSPTGNNATTTTIGGYQVAFINFNQFLGLDDPEVTVSAIQNLRADADFIFVYTHWGEEYVPANDYQKDLARRFIDAGADMVIGSHPHVIQESEMYKGKYIFYSLGNFIFDQYWDETVRKGMGIEVSLSPDGISVKEQLFESMRDGRTCLSV